MLFQFFFETISSSSVSLVLKWSVIWDRRIRSTIKSLYINIIVCVLIFLFVVSTAGISWYLAATWCSLEALTRTEQLNPLCTIPSGRPYLLYSIGNSASVAALDIFVTIYYSFPAAFWDNLCERRRLMAYTPQVLLARLNLHRSSRHVRLEGRRKLWGCHACLQSFKWILPRWGRLDKHSGKQ